MGEILKSAQYWQRLGIAVIPIIYKSKQPKIKWLPYTEQLPTDNEISNWFASDLTNIGIITGWQNLCIIDFDDIEVYTKWYMWAINKGGKARDVATNTRIHKSARGAHVFIQCENAENLKLPKIDVLAHRKYALLPPSLHPTGVRYEIYRGGLPMPVASLYDVLPRVLLDSAMKSAKANTAQYAAMPLTPDPSSSILSNQGIPKNFDPWKIAGREEQNQNLIAEIKRQIPITSILSKCEKSGNSDRWYMTRCPFHDDKNPSMWVDVQKGLCGCQAGCTPLPLDVIDLYARLNGIDNLAAIRELAKRIN